MNNLAPKYLCDMFEERSSIHNRSTRNCNSTQMPLFTTTSDHFPLEELQFGITKTLSYGNVHYLRHLKVSLKTTY